MTYSLIVSVDVLTQHRPAFEEWLRSSFLTVTGVPGVAADPVCFRGMRVETRYRTYQPTPSYIVIFQLEDDPAEVTGAKAFSDWWTKGVAARFEWVEKQSWVVAELVAGPPPPFDYSRVLFTQVDLRPAHQSGWARWYDEVHIPQSRLVPGMFRAENRRFAAVEVATARWHCSAKPSFIHLVPIEDSADIVQGAATPEFLALIADTQAQWAGALESAASTLCERFR